MLTLSYRPIKICGNLVSNSTETCQVLVDFFPNNGCTSSHTFTSATVNISTALRVIIVEIIVLKALSEVKSCVVGPDITYCILLTKLRLVHLLSR